MEHSGRRSEKRKLRGKLGVSTYCCEYSAVEYNKMRKRSTWLSVNSKLSMGIKLLVTGKYSEEK